MKGFIVPYFIGENSGYVTLLSSQGEKIWRDKLHKSKVTNIQYSPREPWLFVTTSTDNSVKIWDVRNLTDDTGTNLPRKGRCLQSLEHEKAVNSAYFSHVDGTKLLTTDQHSQIRVYKGKMSPISENTEYLLAFVKYVSYPQCKKVLN